MKMPIVVLANGPTAAAVGHDIPERQVLIGMDDAPQPYWLHILMIRLDAARWITVDPEGDVAVDDLSEEELIPVVRGGALPVAGRPFLVHDPLDEAALAALRARALALAEIHGATAAIAPLSGPAGWYYADPALGTFGSEVPIALVADPLATKLAGAVGILRVTPVTWVHIERVMRADVVSWRAEKREGAGRDIRLTSVAEPLAQAPQPLYREVLSGSAMPTVMLNLRVFEGPSALEDLLGSIQRSGLEPPAYTASFLRNAGLGARSPVGIEYSYLIHLLYLFMVTDRLNPRASAAMEHLARRCLQIQRAAQRNPRTPDFDGLEEFMRHAADSAGVAHSPGFDKHISERQKAESQILKQHRLQREELDHDSKNKKNHKNDKAPKGGGKGDDP